ncbi:DUF5696 domain-containing protein [Halalkalibacter sp. APA_J-10(15)]|uniref:DUF5696 domain-containing protein n=1 Tax=Halalkalibacter sp. APA_J-10(15) TaxID=2933805 RepID=UPI001FF61B12|nr:DUF5696 domain-containing protein [Halalkalibacter sp. APA_J-10(15)]MCK0470994.1 DUF5696 domain-containing protein [Halalkalibacter sp. APA_J-10(15)]
MREARNALLLACFLVTIVLVGCSESTRSVEIDESELTGLDYTQEQALQATFMDERLEGMKGIAENDHLQLFIDDLTGSIAVLHKDSDEIWHSNPTDRDEDPIASGVNQDLLSSQMQIHFYNNFGQGSVINTFSDSVQYDQYKIEEITDGVSVTYQLGRSERSVEDLPLMLSSARYEEITSKLDDGGKRALLIAYTEDTDREIYERNDSALSGLQLERAFMAFDDAGYTEEDLEQDMQELNFTQESLSSRHFQATIEYTLDEDSLIVNVPVSSILYTEDYPVNRISLMRFFGAGGAEDEGSLFVPDGSGALIHFNNGKSKYSAYQQSVYGSDLTMELSDYERTEQTVRLPVFGIIREEGALFGIIEEGASAATINADVNGRVNSYNYVYPSFYVVNKGDVTLQANEQERTLPRFQEEPMDSDFKVRYTFLHGEEASYYGMANYYREYLEKTNGLPEKENEETLVKDIPFYLQLVGSIPKQKHFAGVPYKSLEALTTFEQAEDIVNQMQGRDITNIKLNYLGWFNSGVDHKVPKSISVDRAIGGKSGLHQFVDFAEEKGISLFPEVALLNVNSSSGFNEAREASRTLRGMPATLYPMDLTLERRDRTKSPSYVLSPGRLEAYTESMLNDFVLHETNGISLRDLADQLNSDFRKNKQIDRTESERISVQTMKMIHDENLDIMAKGGNHYTLPYLSDIIDVPINNSGFKIQDEAIPFYQMVIRGSIDYTSTPFNLSTYTNERQYILKSLEYGAGVHFKWIHEPNYKLKDTEYNHLYSVNYEQWIDDATRIYHEINAVLSHVHNESIVAHEKLEEGVYKTVYSNGIYVIVNYNETAVSIDEMEIEAQGYMTGGETF